MFTFDKMTRLMCRGQCQLLNKLASGPVHAKTQVISQSCSLNHWNKKRLLRRPGIKPGSTAWKAAMLTTIPPTPWCKNVVEKYYWFFLVKSGRSKCSHGKSAVIWNLPLIRIPPWSDQQPPSCPTFFCYEFSFLSALHSKASRSNLIRYTAQVKWKSNRNYDNI